MKTAFAIQKIKLRKCPVELTRVNYYSSGAKDPELVTLVVEVALSDASGWGEFIPTSMVYPQGHIGRSSLDEWKVALKIAESLIGKDARDHRSWITEDLRQRDANGLVDAFDFALHDAVGRQAGWPVQLLLGGGSPWIWGMPLIYRDTPEAMAEHARRHFLEGGYQWFKLKPSCNLEQDVAAMRLIREKTRQSVRFYIDPNYTLEKDPERVLAYLNALAVEGLHVCEDPINADLPVYRDIQERTPVEIMLDEKARTLEDVREIGEVARVRRINIHANWAGGFRRACQRAEVAEVFGMKTIVGSSRYLGMGSAAYQTLASVLPDVQDAPCEQINDHDYVRNTVVKNPYKTRDGKIYISREPGFGLEVDQGKLNEMSMQEAVIG